jgi:hypothetical protein
MVASGYMTEANVEAIWDTLWVSARFDLINVRIGEILNFLVHGDAQTDVADTGVIPILTQISEEILLDLKLAAQANAITVPWDFIQANISKMDWKYYDTYLLKKVRDKLGYSTPEVVSRYLPTKTNSNVIP